MIRLDKKGAAAPITMGVFSTFFIVLVATLGAFRALLMQ